VPTGNLVVEEPTTEFAYGVTRCRLPASACWPRGPAHRSGKGATRSPEPRGGMGTLDAAGSSRRREDLATDESTKEPLHGVARCRLPASTCWPWGPRQLEQHEPAAQPWLRPRTGRTRTHGRGGGGATSGRWHRGVRDLGERRERNKRL
jgi:hypothetical protein